MGSTVVLSCNIVHFNIILIAMQYCTVICMVTQFFYSKSIDQPGKVANPARGQLNRENDYSLSAFAPENLVSRDGFSSFVPRQPAHSPYYSG